MFFLPLALADCLLLSPGNNMSLCQTARFKTSPRPDSLNYRALSLLFCARGKGSLNHSSVCLVRSDVDNEGLVNSGD